MADGTVALESVGQISIIVKDVERARNFYRDTLGLTFLFEFPGMAFFDCGGVRLYLARADKPDLGTSILYYRVADIRGTAAALEARGVSFLQRPAKVHEDARHELWLAFLQGLGGEHGGADERGREVGNRDEGRATGPAPGPREPRRVMLARSRWERRPSRTPARPGRRPKEARDVEADALQGARGRCLLRGRAGGCPRLRAGSGETGSRLGRRRARAPIGPATSSSW